MLSLFIAGEADKIELIYTNFISLAKNEPSIRTLLPLQPTGFENEIDEIFKLSS
jgi:F-type H+-transporting ATPase subunit gamma